jgi:hypothetical protein
MPQHKDGLPYDKQADAESVTFGRVGATKGIEDFRHLFIRDTCSGIQDINARIIAKVTAPDQDTSARISVFDRITNYVAENRRQQEGITHHPSRRRYQPNLNSLPGCGPFILLPDLTKKNIKIYVGEAESFDTVP